MTARDQQIRALYQAALERPPAERQSFVAQLSGGDVQLRESVELMLSKHGATDVGAPRSKVTAQGKELPAGEQLGQYRIEGVIGRGGMGVVYRATDTKLQRPVAIKFLSAAVADEEVKRRFRQEAETASGLQHPHIVTVYDVGEHDGRQFIVSELIDGGTLEHWANARRHSWRNCVELLTGIADALAAAHAAGVLHRDVKPGNILIDGNGYAKLADFGLAKLVDSRTHDPASRSANRSHTTQTGVVVGTVAYMSPEQATKQPLDSRSDVFSFGIVLYELLAGRRPFESANDLEVLKALAHATPDPLPDSVPELLRMAVEKALEKDPADRYQTMQDFAADLRRVARKPSGSHAAPSAAHASSRLPWWVAAGLAAALVTALVPATLYFFRAPPPQAQVRFEFPVASYAENGLAVSPDGEQIAFASVVEGARRLWVRPLGAPAARELAGTDGAVGPFWSPDGRSIAFFADGRLKRIDAAGGPATTISDQAMPVSLPGTWSRDGTILVTVGRPGQAGVGLGRVSAAGGPVTLVIEPAAGELGLVMPRLLPDGEHLVYLGGSPEGGALYFDSLTTPGRVRSRPMDLARGVQDRVASLAVAEGFVLYAQGTTLMAHRIDAGAQALVGEARPVAENVAEFAVGAGTLVYREIRASQAGGAPTSARRLVWIDRNGERLAEVAAPPAYRLPVISRDGRRIAVSVRLTGTGPNATPHDLWTIDTERGMATRLTFDAATEDVAVWSPDDARIIFNGSRSGIPVIANSLLQRASNGTGSEERLYSAAPDEFLVPQDVSPDGRYLVFTRSGAATWQQRSDLWLLEMTGERTASALIESPFIKAGVRFSPDGRFIAFTTNESNGNQVVVQPFPDLARGKWQISTGGGASPRWREDGRELYYLEPDGTIMAVDVRADGDVFEAGPPRALVETGVAALAPGVLPDFLYDAAPDGTRFLINELLPTDAGMVPGAESTVPLKVILNWDAGLETG